MSAKKTGHRRQLETPATPATTTSNRYDDLDVAAPRFISASDKLARYPRVRTLKRSYVERFTRAHIIDLQGSTL